MGILKTTKLEFMFIKFVNKVYTRPFFKNKKPLYNFYLSYNLVETITFSNYFSKNNSLTSVKSTSDSVERFTSLPNQNIDQGPVWIFLFVFAIGLLLASFILEKNENF